MRVRASRYNPRPMQVYVNGDAREVQPGTTLAELLTALAAPGSGIAVEVNLELVRRADHASRELAAEDRVEIVGLVGGG